MVTSPARWTIRSLLIACGVALLATTQGVYADSYQVQAAVPYPAPTQAAAFSAGLDGTTVATPLFVLTGTCQVQNPATVVTIMLGSTVLGSATCDGTFSIQVALHEGSNELIARTANASELYAPDSSPITVTLVLPPTVTPTPSEPISSPVPTSAGQLTTASGAAAAGDLELTTIEPFSVLDTSNTVTIHVRVSGGQTPYTITLNWGDGSVDTHTVTEPGDYSYDHAYEKNSNYTVRATVRDVLGASTVFSYAVVSSKRSTVSATTRPAATDTGITPWLREHRVALVSTAAITSLVASSYWLGLHKAAGSILQTRQASLQRGARPKASKVSSKATSRKTRR